MKTLALEFSSPARSAAVLSISSTGAAPVILGHASDESGNAVKPLALIDLALQRAGIEREAIECLAVGLGPGSYTGIRSAIALAQGWQLGRAVNLLGVSSVDCLAEAARTKGWLTSVGVVIDAQRDEFYFTGYEVSESGWRLKEPLHIASKADIPALASTYPTLIGPEVTRFFTEGRILFPDAGVLGGLARGRVDFADGEKLEPIYLRETKFVKAPPPRDFFSPTSRKK